MWAQILSTVIEPVSKLIDSAHFSGQEKAELHNKLQEIFSNAELESQKISAQFETEITTRHKSDMQSDSWMSKNVRPIIVIFLTGIFALMSLTDGTIQIGGYVFAVKDDYISVYQTLLVTVYGFYFSSRGLEKSVKMFNTRSKENQTDGREQLRQ